MWYTANLCAYVSNDIPLDVGWHTYTLDLYNPAFGTPVMVTPPCSQKTPWKDAPTITKLRVDPNENYTGEFPGNAYSDAVSPMVFQQQIDYIKLTKMEQIKAGTFYKVEFTSNKSLPASSYKVYYTSDLAFPRQSAALDAQPTAPVVVRPYSIFLPFASNLSADVSSPQRSGWNTTGVTPGVYYVCIEANDTLNASIQCSNAPIEITN
jgi:hypothetical protein